jgi:predicted nucleic acid-binding protein
VIVDASVWVSSQVAADVHHSESRRWLVDEVHRGASFVLPTLTLPEVAGAIARRTGVPHLGQQAAEMITRTPGVRFVNLDPTLAQEATDLASDQRLRGADAVYVAIALRLGLPLITWDLEMAQRNPAGVRVWTPSLQ